MVGSETYQPLNAPNIKGPFKILIVRAPYYRDISENLLIGATKAIKEAGGEFELIDVPGALEVPIAIGIAERIKKYDGYVALGCVIRGATTHYETVCTESNRGITSLGLQGLCIGNGILTVENREQAEERADPNDQNKGGGAASAAIHLIALARELGNERREVGFNVGMDFN